MSHSKKLITQAHLERTERHATVAAKLSVLGDAELSAVLAAARPLFAGIGGTSLLLRVDELRQLKTS